MQQKVAGWALLALISSSAILHTVAYPQHAPLISQSTSSVRTQNPQYYSNSIPILPQQIAQERKFAEKSNALKKVALDDLDDIQTNSISEGGFSWSNMLGAIMQMIFNPGSTGPNKSDNLDTDSVSPSPWANLLSMGFKILTAILGGGNSDGIDKVDNGSPMQSILAAVLSTVLGAKDPDQVASMAKQAGEFINIVVNLLDALKTSFSHRSLTARSMGRKDSVSDAAIAGIAMMKTYVKAFGTNDDKCLQKYVCDANSECSADIGPKSVFCQLGTYAASFVLERQSSGTFEKFYEAGRRGRSGIDCRQLYLECNEIRQRNWSVVKMCLRDAYCFIKAHSQFSVISDMTMENYLSQTGMAQKQLLERYAEYSGPTHDQSFYYPYEPTQPVQAHGPLFKHHFGGSGGHKNNAAMSALTLLAFLFFLHILQQCLKDHMAAISTPQVMIMSGGRDGEENIAKHSHNKIDKTGEIEADQDNKRTIINHSDPAEKNDSREKHLMKITTSEHDSRKKFQTNKNAFSRYNNQYSTTDYTNGADY